LLLQIDSPVLLINNVHPVRVPGARAIAMRSVVEQSILEFRCIPLRFREQLHYRLNRLKASLEYPLATLIA
jgi:hypothetical protein